MPSRPPYSKRFIGATVAASASIVAGPVPDGKLWLVNCITYCLADGSPGGFVFVTAPGPLYLLSINCAVDPLKGTVMTHQVLNAGETLTVENADPSGSFSFMISGYELSMIP